MWEDYTVPGGTFRENLHGRPESPYLLEEHQAAKFRYSKLKETAKIDEFGNFIINRVPEEEKEIANGIEDLKVSEKIAEVEVKAWRS
jgi:hypothetical protein